jgi:hypothetical protein
MHYLQYSILVKIDLKGHSNKIQVSKKFIIDVEKNSTQ